METFDMNYINTFLKQDANLSKIKDNANIVSAQYTKINTFVNNDQPFLQTEMVFEFAEKSLFDEIKNSKKERFGTEKLTSYLKQISNGLLNAKKAKCAHLKLKEEKILIIKNECQINNWENCYFLNGKKIDDPKNLAFIMGYSAPELIDVIAKETSDKKKKKLMKMDLFSCDVYSFGMIILRCCGVPKKVLLKVPINNRKLHDKYINKTIEEYLKENYPKEIYRLIRNICHFNPSERCTIEEIDEKLKNLEI